MTLKKIGRDDLELLRMWRIQENVTKYMITDPTITKESQIKWFEKVLKDNTRIDYIIMAGNKRIGYYGITNINNDNRSCEVGFYIGDTEYRGKGLFKLIQKKVEGIIYNDLKLNTILISVLENNPIIDFYKKNGFIENKDLERKVIKSNTEYRVFTLIKSLI